MHGLAAAALVNPWLSGLFCSAIEVHVLLTHAGLFQASETAGDMSRHC